ncbi:expressed unknown protein [Seminavis robusta]|uniref:Uncharacterized protein n=1 Tax=Seminavis robusta TaxID=568900 RepID=A0A9N8H683_9STRA|nr:expressed unknown protein [Seminavis robusta]|eukprot:Sro38_g023920.1 n/a (1033) ;mRNA; f:154273-157371
MPSPTPPSAGAADAQLNGLLAVAMAASQVQGQQQMPMPMAMATANKTNSGTGKATGSTSGITGTGTSRTCGGSGPLKKRKAPPLDAAPAPPAAVVAASSAAAVVAASSAAAAATTSGAPPAPKVMKALPGSAFASYATAFTPTTCTTSASASARTSTTAVTNTNVQPNIKPTPTPAPANININIDMKPPPPVVPVAAKATAPAPTPSANSQQQQQQQQLNDASFVASQLYLSQYLHAYQNCKQSQKGEHKETYHDTLVWLTCQVLQDAFPNNKQQLQQLPPARETHMFVAMLQHLNATNNNKFPILQTWLKQKLQINLQQTQQAQAQVQVQAQDQQQDQDKKPAAKPQPNRQQQTQPTQNNANAQHLPADLAQLLNALSANGQQGELANQLKARMATSSSTTGAAAAATANTTHQQKQGHEREPAAALSMLSAAAARATGTPNLKSQSQPQHKQQPSVLSQTGHAKAAATKALTKQAMAQTKTQGQAIGSQRRQSGAATGTNQQNISQLLNQLASYGQQGDLVHKLKGLVATSSESETGNTAATVARPTQTSTANLDRLQNQQQNHKESLALLNAASARTAAGPPGTGHDQGPSTPHQRGLSGNIPPNNNNNNNIADQLNALLELSKTTRMATAAARTTTAAPVPPSPSNSSSNNNNNNMAEQLRALLELSSSKKDTAPSDDTTQTAAATTRTTAGIPASSSNNNKNNGIADQLRALLELSKTAGATSDARHLNTTHAADATERSMQAQTTSTSNAATNISNDGVGYPVSTALLRALVARTNHSVAGNSNTASAAANDYSIAQNIGRRPSARSTVDAAAMVPQRNDATTGSTAVNSGNGVRNQSQAGASGLIPVAVTAAIPTRSSAPAPQADVATLIESLLRRQASNPPTGQHPQHASSLPTGESTTEAARATAPAPTQATNVLNLAELIGNMMNPTAPQALQGTVQQRRQSSLSLVRPSASNLAALAPGSANAQDPNIARLIQQLVGSPAPPPVQERRASVTLQSTESNRQPLQDLVSQLPPALRDALFRK